MGFSPFEVVWVVVSALVLSVSGEELDHRAADRLLSPRERERERWFGFRAAFEFCRDSAWACESLLIMKGLRAALGCRVELHIFVL